jgi:hypothetical protein
MVRPPEVFEAEIGEPDFFKAVKNGDLQEVNRFIKGGAGVNVRDQSGDTALIIASALKGNKGMMSALLGAHADVNAKGHFGHTALTKAVVANNREGVKALLAAGADMSVVTDAGDTALTLAVVWADLAMVRYLLSADADVNVKDAYGKTALDIVNEHESLNVPASKKKEYEEIKKLLVEAAERGHQKVEANNLTKGSYAESVKRILKPQQAKAPQSGLTWWQRFKNYVKGIRFAGLAGGMESQKSSTERSATLGERPPHVQAAVDKAFEANKDATWADWLCCGSDYYELVGLNDDNLLKNLALDNRQKKDIYIIDLGGGKGDWGRHAMDVLQSEAHKKSGKRFHIFSVTGGKECDEAAQKKGNVTLYQFNQFKIENLDEEFSKRGFNLKDNVDLIVSNWTLRHLVDPFGTLKRMYGLLTPIKGKLMSNGFLFMFNDSPDLKTFPLNNENILAQSNATVLFRDYRKQRDTGQFLLVRGDKNELRIPLEYTDKVQSITGYLNQNASNVVTVFSKLPLDNTRFDRTSIDDIDRANGIEIYCAKDDQRCKNLYFSLKREGFFVSND